MECGWNDRGKESNRVCLTVKAKYGAAAKRAYTVEKKQLLSNW